MSKHVVNIEWDFEWGNLVWGKKNRNFYFYFPAPTSNLIAHWRWSLGHSVKKPWMHCRPPLFLISSQFQRRRPPTKNEVLCCFSLGDFLCIPTPNTGQMNPLFHTFAEFRLIAEFPPALEYLENLEKWDNFFQSGKSQEILKKCQKVREKSGNFK